MPFFHVAISNHRLWQAFNALNSTYSMHNHTGDWFELKIIISFDLMGSRCFSYWLLLLISNASFLLRYSRVFASEWMRERSLSSVEPEEYEFFDETRWILYCMDNKYCTLHLARISTYRSENYLQKETYDSIYRLDSDLTINKMNHMTHTHNMFLCVYHIEVDREVKGLNWIM